MQHQRRLTQSSEKVRPLPSSLLKFVWAVLITRFEGIEVPVFPRWEKVVMTHHWLNFHKTTLPPYCLISRLKSHPFILLNSQKKRNTWGRMNGPFEGGVTDGLPSRNLTQTYNQVQNLSRCSFLWFWKTSDLIVPTVWLPEHVALQLLVPTYWNMINNDRSSHRLKHVLTGSLF